MSLFEAFGGDALWPATESSTMMAERSGCRSRGEEGRTCLSSAHQVRTLWTRSLSVSLTVSAILSFEGPVALVTGRS